MNRRNAALCVSFLLRFSFPWPYVYGKGNLLSLQGLSVNFPLKFTLLFVFSLHLQVYAQVGLGTANPQATLDVVSGNPANPLPTDGILVPRINGFSSVNPGTNQHGMLVFLTTASGSNAPGFYFWDNNAAAWKPLQSTHNTLNQAYNQGGLGAGRIITVHNGRPIVLEGSSKVLELSSDNVGAYDYSMRITSQLNGVKSSSLKIYTYGYGMSGQTSSIIENYIDYTNVTGNMMVGIQNKFVLGTMNGSGPNIGYRGMYNDFYSVNNPNGANKGVVNVFRSDTKYMVGTENVFSSDGYLSIGVWNRQSYNPDSEFRGVMNELVQTSASGRDKYGTYTILSGNGNGTKFGTYINITATAGGAHYGVYSKVLKNTGYAGYFIGKMSLGGSLTGRYEMPLIDGTANQIMATDGAGQVHFMDAASVFTDTRNTLDGAYDEGGPGAGRTIRADAGTIRILGNYGLDISGANARITVSNSAEDESGILFNDADTPGQFAKMYYHNATSVNKLLFYVNLNTPLITLSSTQKVGINRTPLTNTLEVNGNASKSTAGNWLANSDRRLKKNIRNIPGEWALAQIERMQGVSFFWNDDKTGTVRPPTKQYGFIAQDLMQIFPEKVSKDSLGYYQTAYGDYDPLFVEAIKTLYRKIQELERENKTLKAMLETLKASGSIHPTTKK